jgi:hypothetical protein
LHEGARERREKWKCLNFPPNDYTHFSWEKGGGVGMDKRSYKENEKREL